ncbi:disintegrin and metalloproteinase domain-containing protein 10 isoform X2 [Drosophila miranda]|uniref:disintegrin and metalloproteinase domain-containing protein 10 isoform X2 n=1 Tax=Drosophila miranda TaxID=7229 RepID=UPI0007E5BE76|nr:disintegrin and metalloproteinase domain-containing protein 10 isoform X2 [Drosophila miranda]
MSSKCAFNIAFVSIIFIIIVNGYAKDISGVKRGHERLNEYISHYETLDYDHEHIRASHNRARRSVTKDHFVHLKFASHGRDFHLRLKRDLNTFSDKLDFYDSNGPIDVSTDHIYAGEVIGERNSFVFGSIHNGVFEGKIITERDAYYVEHAKHYFPTNRTAISSTTESFTAAPRSRSTIGARPLGSRNSNKYTNNYNRTAVDNKTENFIKKIAESTTTSTSTATATATATTTTVLPSPSGLSEESTTTARTTFPPTTTTEHVEEQQQEQQQEQQDNAEDELDFHSIIYKESHVEDAYENVREGHVGGCGITDEVSQWMENIQNSAVEELPEPMSKDYQKLHRKQLHKKSAPQQQQQQHPPKKYMSGEDDFKFPHQKYSKEANFADGAFYDPSTGRRLGSSANVGDWHEFVHERVRRASDGGSGSSGGSGPARGREDNKNTCSLYIQTDPLIWRHIREGIADHDRGRKYEVDVKTREEITSLIAHHVTAVNYIYRNTKFDGRTEHRNIRFEVQRIKIDDDSACRNSYNGPHNAFCNEHMDVSNFLNLHSLEDHSDFCLAYVFTYRDFTGGTLGLAWVASASGASGGICEKYKTYTETVGGQYQSTKRSLNTGIITFVNYNSRVPPKVSQLTLAHEIGHNFGSPHDYPQECRPGGLNGNFIMFASATSGDRPNNSKFSPCSIRNISNVLDVLVGNTKRDCFKASEGAFCGNKIVESGEECDCGFNEEECKDKCCYPRLISEYDQSLNSSAKGCTRRAKTECSPSQGPCCLANSCTFVPTRYHQKCKEETECSWSSTCNGTTAECPEPRHRDDKTMCNNGTALCIRGECSGSPCLLWNMTKCFLTSFTTPHADKRKLCDLACQDGNDTSTCRSTSEFAEKYNIQKGGISLQPGSPCDNFQGYCDVFLKCRAVDADGPLVRLKNLLLNRETLQTVAEWVTENWYLVVLMGVAFIVVMGAFIKCCAVHTPSSNPKKRRARRISETLRAPMNTLRRMQRHQHQRGAGPRSIPPPAHEAQHYPRGGDGRGGGGGGRHGGSRSHHQAHPHDWDRHQGGHSIVPLPTGGGHVSRSSAANQARRSDGRGTRSTSSGRPLGPVAGAAAAAAVGGAGGSRAHGGYGAEQAIPGSIGGGVQAAISSGGVVARAQLPLPLPPANALQQQQQQQQQQALSPQQPQPAFYAPKAVAPPLLQVSFSRPTSLHEQQQQQHQQQHQQQQQQQLEQEQQLETQQQQQAYADAYTALGRGQYESTARTPNNSKV